MTINQDHQIEGKRRWHALLISGDTRLNEGINSSLPGVALLCEIGYSRMLRHDIGRLPVVDRDNERKAIGYIGRANILAARERYYHDEEFRSRGFAPEEELRIAD